MTNKFDIEVLFNNYDILRKSKHLSKGEFNKLIGIKNVFRRNYFSIGVKLLKGIQQNFPGITEEWLLTKHDKDYKLTENNKIRQVGSYPISEDQPPYNHKTTPPTFSQLMDKTSAVLESNTVFSEALKSNIEAFHTAIDFNEELQKSQQKIKELENTVKSIEARLLPLEKIS